MKKEAISLIVGTVWMFNLKMTRHNSGRRFVMKQNREDNHEKQIYNLNQVFLINKSGGNQ